MFSALGRVAALLFTGGPPVRVHTRLHPSVCAERLGRIPTGFGPSFYRPTLDWGPRIRSDGDGVKIWFPGLGQSSHGFLRLRLEPDATGQGTWATGQVRIVAIWRILLLTIVGLVVSYLLFALFRALTGDTGELLSPGPIVFVLVVATGARQTLAADRQLRAWLTSTLEATPADPPPVQPERSH